MESATHKKLVQALVEKFEKDGLKVTHATLEGRKYKAPYKIGRHEPDIIAQDSRGVLIIGEAKTKDDLDSETSKEQFLDFSSMMMSESILRGMSVPLHIIVKENALSDLKSVLVFLGLDYKINNRIQIWTLK